MILVAEFMPQMLRKSRGSTGERARAGTPLDRRDEWAALHVLNFVECVRAGNTKTNCDIDAAFMEGITRALSPS